MSSLCTAYGSKSFQAQLRQWYPMPPPPLRTLSAAERAVTELERDVALFEKGMTAAKTAADTYMKAWESRTWITNPADMPQPPSSVGDMYLVHSAMQDHVLAESAFGGLAGYKIGAGGIIKGEMAISGPLFKLFVVNGQFPTRRDEKAACLSLPTSPCQEAKEAGSLSLPPRSESSLSEEAGGLGGARGGGVGSDIRKQGLVSAAAINLHTLEVEVGMIMRVDLTPRPDGRPHTAQEVWHAVESVVPVIEMCGRRYNADCIAAQPPLGRLADAFNSGGAVLGSPCPRDSVDLAALSTASTSLHINGVEVASGSTGNVPGGGPVESLTWCANHLNSRGLSLQRGHLVITGATCKCSSSAFKVGDAVSANVGELGSVDSTISP